MTRGFQLRLTLFVWLSIAATLFCILNYRPAHAAINQQINFQGKLTNTDGTNVTNGTYSIVFSMYTVASAGSNVWTETQSGVTVTDGVFQVSLGSVTALPGSVDFNNSNLYLGIKVGTDAEMTPRIRFTASPYAFNTSALNGIASSGFVQLGQSATAQADASTNAAIFVNKTGASGNILQLQNNGADVFTIANAGAVTVAGSLSQTTGTTLFQNATYTNNAFTVNNGVSGATPTIPGSFMPTEIIRVSQTSGSRPLFFGYDNGAGTGWASYLTAGACGSFTQMCLDLGNGTTTSTAFENSGTSLFLGGGDDGNFTNVQFKNTGTTLFTAAAAPTVDQVSISNAATPTITNGVSGLHVTYAGGAAAVDGAGIRIDYAPGTTSGGTWSGMKIVSGSAGAAAGVNSYGLRLEGPSGTGSGTETGISVATGWDIGLDVQSGGLQLATQNDPAAPSANNLRIYAKNVAGRMMLKAKGPTGGDYTLQPSLFQNNIVMMNYSTAGNGPSTFNTTALTVGTINATVSEALGQMKTITTAATANTQAAIYASDASFYRGSTSNSANGFFFQARVAIPATQTTTSRFFVGMTDQTTAANTSDNPAGNRIGLSYAAARGANWYVTSKDNTTETLVNTTMPVATTAAVYDVYVFCPAQGSAIYWRIDNLTAGTTQQDITTGITTNLPTAATALRPGVFSGTSAASTRAIYMNHVYVESDR